MANCFTSEAFTGVLKAQGIAISMDGRARALYNTLWNGSDETTSHSTGFVKDTNLVTGYGVASNTKTYI